MDSVLKQYEGLLILPGNVPYFFHRDPDLAVVVLILGATLKLAGVAVQLHIDTRSDLIVGVRGQPLGRKFAGFSPWAPGASGPVQGNTAQV